MSIFLPATLIDFIPGRRLLNPTRRPVHDTHVLFAYRLVLALHQVAHVGIRAISRAARHGRISPVPELVEVVLYAPVRAPRGRVAFADLAGEDLIGRVVRRLPHRVAFRVAEHGFAHLKIVALARRPR